MTKRVLLVMCIIALIAAFGFASSPDPEPRSTGEAMVGGMEGEGVQTFNTVTDYESETGNTMPAYSESPMLAAMVSSGDLPALSDRLPDDPSVAVPLESVGTFGGTLTVDATYFRDLLKRGLFMRDVNGAKVIPDLALGSDRNDDYTQYKIYLRPGTKWSDGEPFTTADIMFLWNDDRNNEELTPSGPSWIWANADLSAVDDYTLQVDFSVPAPTFIETLSHPYTASRGHFFVPAHFQKQYHIDYNSDADDLAKEEGFETWVQLYRHHAAAWVWETQENLPLLTPWTITTSNSTRIEAVRNPYFWQVDTAGNQLPYIDNVLGVKSQQGENQTKILQAIGGEVDYLSGFGILALSDFPLLKENEEVGDYRVQNLKGDFQSAFTVGFNPTVKDPALAELFHDIRFRQALSIAIDRDALNESVFFGLAIPRQVAPLPNVSFYDDDWSDYMIEYDVDGANDLLDDMGLEWDADRELRLRSDGQPINILMESGHGSVPEATVAEVIKAMWEDVGVTLTIKPEKMTHERLNVDEVYEMMIVDGGGNSTEMDLQGSELTFWNVGGGGFQWNLWLSTDGAEGVEPPQEWKDLHEKAQRSLTLVPGTDEWIDLKQEIWDWRIKQLWHIGTVYAAPVFDVVGNDLHNVASGFWFGWSIGFHPLLMTQQWYLDQ